MTSTNPLGMELALVHHAKPVGKFGKEFKAVIRAVSQGAIRPAAPNSGSRQNMRREAFEAQLAKVTAQFQGESRRARRTIARNAVRLLDAKDAILNAATGQNTNQD